MSKKPGEYISVSFLQESGLGKILHFWNFLNYESQREKMIIPPSTDHHPLTVHALTSPSSPFLVPFHQTAVPLVSLVLLYANTFLTSRTALSIPFLPNHPPQAALWPFLLTLWPRDINASEGLPPLASPKGARNNMEQSQHGGIQKKVFFFLPRDCLQFCSLKSLFPVPSWHVSEVCSDFTKSSLLKNLNLSSDLML